MDDEKQLYKDAILGQDAEQFFTTELGQWVLKKSLAESEKAATELRAVDPENSKAVRELQNEIMIAERCLIWFNNAIRAGKQALEILEERE